MKLELLTYPDERLLTPAKSVILWTEEHNAAAIEMVRIMREHNGLGLAANQVGYPYSFFVMCSPDPSHMDDVLVVINPNIVSFEDFKPLNEGCLSLPGMCLQVERANKIVVCYKTIKDGKLVNKINTFTGLVAQCVQHECDHLKGILMHDKV